MKEVNRWMERGWVPPGQGGSGSSDARSDTMEMDRFENMSNLSCSWIKVDESKQELEGMEVDDNEELAKDDEKGMDQDDKQDREELAKEEEKGQVSP